MQIQIIGDNDTARATRTRLRQAGFAVMPAAQMDGTADATYAAYTAHTLAARKAPRACYSVIIEESDQSGWIHFDSVDCALEQHVLKHVTALSRQPVSIDRPGGEVRSDRELRIIIPVENPAQSSAVEFGILRGLLELTHTPANESNVAGRSWWRRILDWDRLVGS